MTRAPARPLSVLELQGALEAAWRGEFRPAASRPASSGDQVIPGGSRPGGSSEVAADRRGRPAGGSAEGRRQVAAPHGGGAAARFLPILAASDPVAVVLAAHPGAGASSVALALAGAVAEWAAEAQLVECAAPERSGLSAATDRELGVSDTGWRLGTRGGVTIHRPAAADVSGLPSLPRARSTSERNSALILDPACPATDLATGTNWVSELPRAAELVLVLRASVPGVQAAEHLLAQLPQRSPLLAVLGPARWPGVVAACCGPLLAAAREAARVVPMPFDDHFAVTGPTAEPLPKPVLAAARVLARLTFPSSLQPDPGHRTPPTPPHERHHRR